jgi:hypothetical protein
MEGDMHDNGTLKIKVAGRAAPADMGPGQYLARCLHAEIKRRGNQVRAVLTFRCEAGRFDGVLLTCWFAIHKTVSAHHKFAQAYAIAVDRELCVDEEVSLSEFLDKLYVVEAGFRKTNGKNHAAEDPTRCKDSKDFLRVHEIVSLAESATATNESSNEQRTRPSRVRRVVKLSPHGRGDGE